MKENTQTKILQYLENFIDKCNETNSNLDKQNVIKEFYDNNNKLFSKLMNAVYNYHYKYYLTSANILKREDLVDDIDVDDIITNDSYDFFSLLWALNNRIVTGHDAIKMVNNFIKVYEPWKDIILRVIDKDLKCRIDAKTLNKVIPDLIPTFNVSLGEKFDSNRFNWTEDSWYASRKLDGIRCIAQINNDCSFFSRQGEEFWVLDVLKQEFNKITGLKGLVFDGELSLITEDGSDDFQGIMKQIRRKNHTIQNIRYNIFDVLTQEEFDSKTSKRKFSDRYNHLLELKDMICSEHIKIVEQVKIDSQDIFDSMKEKALENKWEGLMLRKDDFYKGKRSFDLLKYKEFSDAEYIVKSIELGVKPMLIDGTMKDVDCVSALHIEHKGYDVKVGSGLIDSQRIEWKEHPENIIGKTIKVKYFEETIDQNGNISLRFPILLMVYENGRFD